MTVTGVLVLLVELAVVGLLMRVLAGQQAAQVVARSTKSEAAAAAHDAQEAARVAKAILDRLEVLGGKNNQVAHRIEDAAEVVADDLAAAHKRADSVAASAQPGAAADAAATTNPA